MKVGKRLCKAMLSAMLLVFALCGMNAMAANKVVDMKAGTNGGYTYVGVNESSSNTVYHKLKVKSSGALVVSGNTVYSWGTSGISVVLCNSKYQVIDSSSYGSFVNATNEKAQVYGVKKGTYYLKVSGRTNYILATGFKSWTDKGGNSKNKAKTIKINKTVKGVMPAGENKADWYKFKVTKNKKLKLTISEEGNGGVQFTVYGPGISKSGSSISCYNAGKTTWLSRGSKKVKASKGTYYIKVTRTSKKTSGVYSVKCTLK